MPIQEININIDPRHFNKPYFQFIKDTTRTQIFFGGASAGKSQFVVGQRTVCDLLKGKRNFLIIRNVARTSRTSTFNQVVQTIHGWGLTPHFKINNSEMTITCSNGYQSLFEGLDNVEKLKSIMPQKGVITDIIIEEATETKHDDIKQLQKRLRGKAGVPKRITLVFNPILRSHWIHEEYFAGRFHDGDRKYQDDGLLIFHSTYKDNRFLELDDIAELEDETSEYFYNVYTLGQWGVLGGVIFTNWKVDDLSLDYLRYDNIKNGLDFGFGEDPAAYNRLHFDRMRKRIYIFNEFHVKGATNPVLANLLRPIVGHELVTCDSAEPKSIQELKDNHINAVGAKKGKDSVNYGIQFLQQHEIIIDKSCQETINEFEQYQWKKLRDGTVLNVPTDKNNHHIDCFVAETLIETRRGLVRIDSLCDKDKVLTRGGYKKILWSEKTRRSQVALAIFDDGTRLVCTKTHKFITESGEKKPLLKLLPGDIVMKVRWRKLTWLVNLLFTTVLNIGDETRTSILPESIRENLHIFIGKFGRMFMGHFRKIWKFIMLIEKLEIIPLKIWSFCPGKSINLNIVENVLINKEIIWSESGILQNNGMQAQKGRHGILNTERKTKRRLFQEKKHVLFAGQFLKMLLGEKIRNFVLWNARLNMQMVFILILKNRFVLFVEKLLKLINIALLKRVRVSAVVNLGIERGVYNLQVDSVWHEYYANGILVGNCIRYALESEMPKEKPRVKPRMAFISPKSIEFVSPEKIERAKQRLRPGEQLIPIWEGDQIVSYEIMRSGTGRRGIYIPGVR